MFWYQSNFKELAMYMKNMFKGQNPFSSIFLLHGLYDTYSIENT